jgi:hypothetical protein
MPIIPIKLRTSTQEVQVEGCVDSGAFYSIFGIKFARALGLNPADGKKRLLVVGNGVLIRVYLFKLIVEVADQSFPAEIGFSSQLGVGFNLIGRKGIFEHFDEVVFRERQREIQFRLL